MTGLSASIASLHWRANRPTSHTNPKKTVKSIIQPDKGAKKRYYILRVRTGKLAFETFKASVEEIKRVVITIEPTSYSLLGGACRELAFLIPSIGKSLGGPSIALELDEFFGRLL